MRCIKDIQFIKLPVAFLFCGTSFFVLNGQNTDIRFDNTINEQGLADIQINVIIQDLNGFIWIGSQEGLTRYDGYNCVVYRHQDDNPNSISDNEIYALCTDEEGSLWIGTRNGLNRYDAQYDHFENFFHDSTNLNSISSNEVFALAKDPTGNLWIGTYGGGMDIMIKQKRNKISNKTSYNFLHFKYSNTDSNTISDNRIYAIYINETGETLIGTQGGLCIMSTDRKKISRYYHSFTNSNTIASNSIYGIKKSNDGTFWLTGKGMLDNIALKTGGQKININVEHFLSKLAGKNNLSEWAINDFVITADNFAWVATNDQGLLRFKIIHGKKNIYTDRYVGGSNILHKLVGPVIYNMYEDVSGVLWMGTNKGVSKYIPFQNRFRIFQLPNNIFQADHQSIMSLLFDTGNKLWIGIDADSVFVISVTNNTAPYKIKLTNKPLPEFEQINALYKSRCGDIYVGTFLQGLFIIPHTLQNLNDKKNWKHISKSKFNGLPSNNIYYIAEDRKGFIWIGTYSGLCRYNPQTDELEPVYISPRGTVDSRYIIRTIYVDEHGNIWAGTDDGLYIIQNNRVIKVYKNKKNDSASLSNNRITVIFNDSKNNLWVGTREGLNLFDKIGDKFIKFTSQNGFPDCGIISMKEDTKGNLWIGTYNGLVKFDIQSKFVKTYTTEDGLVSEDFLMNAVSSDSSGIIYFGTSTGLISFHPDSIRTNLFVPPVVFTDIKILDRALSSLTDTTIINTYKREKKLILHYDQNFFSFRFAALNYINSEKNQYAYKLEGVDRQWNDCGTQRFATYSDVSPGHYVFKVKGSNNDGIWNERGTAITIIILPPWYRTWWAYALYALVFIAVLWNFIKWREKRVKKEAELKRQKIDLEMQALRAQMNPHFIFNSLNSISRFILKNQRVEANDYLTKFSKLIRMTLQHSAMTTIKLANELSMLQLYLELECLRFNKKIAYEFQCDPNLDSELIEIPPLLLQPYVENAIWHGLMLKKEDGHLWINIKQEEKYLVCSITDDGIGRKKAAELKNATAATHKSIGMNITASRIALLNQSKQLKSDVKIVDLVLEDGTPGGTQVIINLPLIYD